MMHENWYGFVPGAWQDEINVRDFINKNYTEYRGDESFLSRSNALSRIYSGLDGLIPLWQESLSGASADTVDLAAESILLYSFSKIFGAASERNGLIGQIARITEQGFSNPALSLATVARELSYHPKYISNLFKRKMGVGYAEYLRSVRIKHAITLLDHGIESIKNVALLSGFTDPLYFSSVFKKCTGTSPTEYLRSKAK